jgi:transcriptional regulator with XRE-family HTH domain
MPLSSSTKNVRALGRMLKEVRESQGHNLAILARECNLSVVQLTAIERGDSLAFARSQSNLLRAIEAYASILGISIQAAEVLEKNQEEDIYIPAFLRKK